MQVVLRVVGGKNDGREITIAVPRFIIGRGDTAHLRPSSDLVSREHCAIVVGDDGVVTISDLGSRNGTFVNGTQLSADHPAQSGDSLRVGRLHFEIVIDPVKAGTKKPRVTDVVEAASRAASTKKKMSLEDSITDWLMDGGEEDDDPTTSERTKIASAETIQLNLEETSVFGGSNVDRTKKKDDDSSTDSGSESKKAGKLPAIPKNTHESSTSAADDVLRKFFNRR